MTAHAEPAHPEAPPPEHPHPEHPHAVPPHAGPPHAEPAQTRLLLPPGSQAPPLGWSGPRLLAACAGLLLLGFIAMGQVLRFNFLSWDDPHTLWANVLLNPPKWSVLLGVWNPRNHLAGLYVPVTYTVWGLLATFAWTPIPKDGLPGFLDPVPFRAASLAVHLVSGVLVYFLVRRLLRTPQGRYREWPALLGAAVFVVHPLQVEAVGWASGFKDLLCGMFVLAAVSCYAASLDSPPRSPTDSAGRRKRLFYWAGFAFFVLGWLSKPTAMVTPALATVVGWLMVRPSLPTDAPRPTLGAVVRSLWPWWALVPVIMAITKYAQPADEFVAVPWALRPLIAADAITFYLRKLLLPFDLTFDYGRTPEVIRQTGAIWTTWVVSGAVGAWALLRHGRRPLPAGALAWFVVAVSPVLGLTPFLFQFYSTVADHYVYLAMAGVAVAAAGGLAAVPTRLAPASRTLAAVVLGVLTLLSAVQMGTWRSDKTLYTHALAINPQSHVSINNLAMARIYELGADPPRNALLACIADIDKAIALKPDHPAYYQQRADQAARLALRELRAGDKVQGNLHREEALANLQQYLALSRKYSATDRDKLHRSYILLAQYLIEINRPADALAALAAADEELAKLWIPYPESRERIDQLRPRAQALLQAARTTMSPADTSPVTPSPATPFPATPSPSARP